jgi:hypothetical protein
MPVKLVVVVESSDSATRARPTESEDSAGTTHEIAALSAGGGSLAIMRILPIPTDPSRRAEKSLRFLGNYDGTDYLIDLNMEKKAHNRRPFLGMYFKCCRVYSRIYINKKQTAFVGWCPRCAAKVEVKISPTGSNSKFFSAG